MILGAAVLDDADAIKNKLSALNPQARQVELDQLSGRVILPYLIIVVVLVVLALVVRRSNLPEADADEENEAVAAANINKTKITQFPHLLLGVLTLFLYVGVEVIAGNTIISYGASQGVALATAKFFTAFTMIGMLAGYIIGIICIPRYISQERALKISAILGLLFAAGALSTQGYSSIFFIALLGLANSLMWPSIWPLAISDLGRFTKAGSSLLVMAIAGGAIIPLVYGYFADVFSPREAYWIVVPCYITIWYYAAYGHRIRIYKSEKLNK